jgi:hypothetical protein
MQAKLIISFEHLSESDFLVKAETIIAAMTGNSHYAEPWPPQAPSLAELTLALNTYKKDYHASLTRDTLKIAQRISSRQSLTELLKRLPSYLEFIAQGDTAMLSTTGYDLRKDINYTPSNEILAAPNDFRVSHGIKKGTLIVHVALLADAGSYEVQITKGDPNVEANWQHATSSLTSFQILLEGLIPTQIYWIRIRGIGRNGSGAWAEPISIIVN